MGRVQLSPKDPQFEATVRILGAAANARILHVLVEARRKDPQGGWKFLSEIAEAVSESPGAVSPAVQKLLPLLEERREKGRRFFRARARVLIELDYF